MTHCRVILVAMLVLCSTFNPLARDKVPEIELRGNEFVLTLPDEMAAALVRFNPKFETWKTGDYVAAVRDAARNAANPRRAPFALIVDADRDGSPDAILDGHDDRESLLICVFAQPRDCRVDVLRRRKLAIPSEMVSYRDGKKETGLEYYLSDSCLWSSEPDFDKDKTFVFQIVYPQQSGVGGELLKSGGSVSYYFENGRFSEGDFDSL